MLLPELQCANWRDSKNGRQVEVYGLGWSNNDLAAAMSELRWQGNVDELEEWLERRSKRRLQVTIERPLSATGDTVYVVEPDERSAGEVEFRLSLPPYEFSVDGDFGISHDRLSRFLRRFMRQHQRVEEPELQDAFQDHFQTPAIVNVIVSARSTSVRVWKPGLSHEVWSGPRPPRPQS